MIAAVLVPPSACNTSQSTVMVLSPIRLKSKLALRDLPISRCISWDRPFFWFPLDDLGVVDPGNMEYSAVIHPLFWPMRKGGTLVSILAVHKTLVEPVEITADPSQNCIVLVSIIVSLRSLLFLPSILINISPFLICFNINESLLL